MANGKLYCSFCSKSQNDVKKMIAAPIGEICICYECIDLASKLAHEGEKPAFDPENPKQIFSVAISLHPAFNDVAPADINLIVEKIESPVREKFLELAKQNTEHGAPQLIAEPVPDTNNPSIKTASVNFAIDSKDLDTIFPLSQRLVLASKDFKDAVHAIIVKAHIEQSENELQKGIESRESELNTFAAEKRSGISVFQALLPTR